MAPKTYGWISAWFLATAPLMLWDASYCFMRPRSMVGGDLHWIWKLYAWYAKVDHVYGVKAFENGEGFAGAAAVLNVLEISTNLIYMYQAYIARSDVAPLIGYTGAVMTLAKTLLYITQEYFCGYCSVGHNNFLPAFLAWILPNAAGHCFIDEGGQGCQGPVISGGRGPYLFVVGNIRSRLVWYGSIDDSLSE
ncbi:hypothetical protein Hypma_006315 [Hypsizygus marmoreus]|uniref:Uncharacterized protein n=1 Tax=Hypsizygus marmoreus TaxID=39966 RepID=A0A369JT71_HYPMA|nr:hypothetical protein Hypma_006315 [Hypsizygus marmoreus]